MKKRLFCLLTVSVLLLFPLCGLSETVEKGAWNAYVHSYTNKDGQAAEMAYELYFPASWDGETALPLLTYIPDAGYVGRGVKAVETAECPKYWLTEEMTEKHPAIWLILDISDADSDVRVEGNQSAQIMPIIERVCAEYPIDTDRLYLTGQSMGGIMDFALNTFYPDTFAATVYIACQPGGEVHDAIYDEILEAEAYLNQKFVYFCSRLDIKAHVGQDDVEERLISRGAEFGKLYGLTAKSDTLNEEAAALLNQGYEKNLLGFEQIVVTKDGSVSMMEHMKSFSYAYKATALMDWLFAQSK
ncbi:MAG: hypothetical protein IJ662_04465 [Clostridia bacterium]|nr:hypothetical protein [Clostridia bacterium]